jgi:MFS family permease
VNPPSEPSNDAGLLTNSRFVRYSYAKLLSLLGQNALVYGLFIAVISDQDSSLATSAFVLASVIPSIVLSLPGGLVADLLPKKLVLLASTTARLLIVYLFIRFDPNVEQVIGLTFLFWTAYQFFSPAENAIVLAIVPRERFAQASSLLQALSLVAQLLGAGVLAPLIVKLLDLEGLYIIAFACIFVSALVFASIPHLTPARGGQVERVVWSRALPAGYRTIAADARLTSITLMRVLLDTGMLMFIVAAPVFIEDTLDTSAGNAVYIALPGAIGLALGLLLAPLLLSFVSARGVALAGFVAFTGVLLALPFVDAFAPEVTAVFGPLDDFAGWLGISDAIVATAALLPIAGAGSSFVHVAARTEVYRRVPGNLVAQVFATQSALGSIAALAPTFLAGVLLDQLPVRVVLVLIGGSLTACALLAWLKGARRPRAPNGEAAPLQERPSGDSGDWA